jgi:hypothetical protein
MISIGIYPLIALVFIYAPYTSKQNSVNHYAEVSKVNNAFYTTVNNWRTQQSKDEMTGERTSYAMSSSTTSRSPMQFPYTGTTATLGVGCNKNSEWAYLIFSNAPNLLNTKISDGYNSISTRFRWDDKIETMSLIQKWGATSIHFTGTDKNKAINYMIASNSVLVELDWYGENKTYFNMSLAGAGNAISKIRRECSTF